VSTAPLLDTRRQIQTPEGITLPLTLAGPVSRGLAWVLDLLIRAAIYTGLGIVLGQLENFGFGLFLIAIFLLEWFYPVLFEVLRDGATPGKRAMGLQVLHDDGTPIGWTASMVRNLLRAVDFLPVFYAFGLVSMLLNDEFKRLGDLVAGSVVVYRSERSGEPTLPEQRPQPPRHALDLDEQQAILSLAERSPRLTRERVEELAGIARPIMEPGGQASARLLAIANWLAGRR
jgi:uncharacterized RDD family membrane protein YckC